MCASSTSALWFYFKLCEQNEKIRLAKMFKTPSRKNSRFSFIISTGAQFKFCWAEIGREQIKNEICFVLLVQVLKLFVVHRKIVLLFLQWKGAKTSIKLRFAIFKSPVQNLLQGKLRVVWGKQIENSKHYSESAFKLNLISWICTCNNVDMVSVRSDY